MKISLRLLSEKLGLDDAAMYLSENSHGKYGHILLYLPGMILSPDDRQDTLFITNARKLTVPDWRLIRQINAAFVFAGLSAEELSSLPREHSDDISEKDYLCVADGRSFGDAFNHILKTHQKLLTQLTNLQAMAARRCSLQEMIESLFPLFGNPAYLVDTSFKVLAIDKSHGMRDLSRTWRRAEDDGYLPLDLVSRLIQSRELEEVERHGMAKFVYPAYFYTPFINYNIRHKGIIQGHLFIVTMFRRTTTPGDLELTDLVAETIWQSMKNNDLYQRRRGYLYENFMKDMYEGKIRDVAYIREQIRYLNIDMHTLYAVADVLTEESSETGIERISSHMERSFDLRLVKYPNRIKALLLPKARENFPEQLTKLYEIASSHKVRIGVSDLSESLLEVPFLSQQSERALAACIQNTVCLYENIALEDLLTAAAGVKDVFCAPEIRSLLNTEKENGDMMADTLYTFLENDCSIAVTADCMHIHRNTLSYRLDRLHTLYSIDLKDPRKKRRYFLSLMLLKHNH